MTREERPITFTITTVGNKGYRMYTKDARVQEKDRDVTISDNMLFAMMTFASGVYNNKGYTVLFEVD